MSAGFYHNIFSQCKELSDWRKPHTKRNFRRQTAQLVIYSSGLLVQQGLVGYAPPSVSLDPEVEKKQLQDEMATLHEEEERLKTSMKLAQIRQEGQKKRQTVKKLRGMKKQLGDASHVSLFGDKSRSKSKHDTESSDSDLDINNLRKDPKLRAVVQKELGKLGLGSVGSVDSDSSGSASGTQDSSDSDVSSAKNIRKSPGVKSLVSMLKLLIG